MENPDLVFHEIGDSQILTRSRLAECDSRQTIQARSNHPDRVVSPYRGLPVNMQPVVLTSSGPVCNEVQQQNASVCVTNNKPPSMDSTFTHSALEGSVPLCLSTGSHFWQVVEKLQDYPCKRIIPIAPEWLIMHWFWDLVGARSHCVCPSCPSCPIC